MRISEEGILYLNLLKRSLTNTIFGEEPDPGQKDVARYTQAAIAHYQQSSAVSMLPLARLDNLQSCIADVVERQVPGDLVETGVWRGGAIIFMRAFLKVLHVTDRLVWGADSFEGLPEPDPIKFPREAQHFKSAANAKYYNHFAVGFDEVRRNIDAYGMLDGQVKFLKGWFKDTLPQSPIKDIAVLRIDGDYYESTRDALVSLYDRVSIGGYIIIDDYGEDTWTYCRKAVDEFRQERGIDDAMVCVDDHCSFWQKAA